MEYESKLDKGYVRTDLSCPFKERNSIGIPCQFTCDEPVNGLIDCAIARLDDSNMKYAHDRMMYNARKIGDFEPC